MTTEPQHVRDMNAREQVALHCWRRLAARCHFEQMMVETLLATREVSKSMMNLRRERWGIKVEQTTHQGSALQAVLSQRWRISPHVERFEATAAERSLTQETAEEDTNRVWGRAGCHNWSSYTCCKQWTRQLESLNRWIYQYGKSDPVGGSFQVLSCFTIAR
jgi:hypothetical protein